MKNLIYTFTKSIRDYAAVIEHPVLHVSPWRRERAPTAAATARPGPGPMRSAVRHRPAGSGEKLPLIFPALGCLVTWVVSVDP